MRQNGQHLCYMNMTLTQALGYLLGLTSLFLVLAFAVVWLIGFCWRQWRGTSGQQEEAVAAAAAGNARARGQSA